MEKEISFKDIVKKIEPKWQQFWQTNKTFKAANPGQKGAEKPKFYCLNMFPYPSGEGLHIGHPLGYTATDILCRFKRMNGFNVLLPMGWDAFGLPAEQYAIKMGVHPAETTKKNIATFKRQLQSLGFSYDWDREISTIDPQYYRWTQWLFKRLYEKGLAYQAEMPVNWCAALGTVLANDEIIDGKSERGGHPVVKIAMRQWVLKITQYADRLLEDLDDVDWPESTKEAQRNWIGRSEGARIHFGELEVFTTRPDTFFGVTFMAIAPEHPLVEKLTSEDQLHEVKRYCEEAAKKNDLQRTDLAKEKSGVFTGAYVVQPLTGRTIPVWVADYVLMGYGTGAVMGVPAHDDRDREFAEKMSLPIVPVIDDTGMLINSSCHQGNFNGLPFEEGGKKIVAALGELNMGEVNVTYRLRDWLFARQRYWGEPIPVIHVLEGKDKGKIRLLKDDELPLELPPVTKYEPTGTGDSPLSAVSEWMNVKDPVTGAAAKRESNTMPGSAGSSWYYLRYMDPHNTHEPWSKSAEKYWGPVDFYLGGQEHAVGHLLYSRFWHKVFYDLGLVSSKEPFKRLFHNGMILAENGEKMSKSKGNVVNPDHVVDQYGADTLRLYEMFLGPLEKSKPWNTHSIEGVYRFLNRFWRLAVNPEGTALESHVQEVPEQEWPKEFAMLFHRTIKQVTEDMAELRFNTAISALMILNNEAMNFLGQHKKVPREVIRVSTLLLSPMAPHMCEEIWQLFGNAHSLAYEAWPRFDVAKTVSDEIDLVVQINGKVRDQVKVAKTISESELKELVFSREAVKKWIEGKEVKKFIYVKGKLVSVVI